MDKESYDLYGIPHGEIEEVRRTLEEVLSIKFVPHGSSFIGEYYRADQGNGSIEIWGNADPIDGERHNDNLPITGILIHVYGTEKTDEIQQALMAKFPKLAVIKRVR